MSGRNHPMPAHQRATLAGALPADPPIAEIEQEQLGPLAVLVQHNGPATVTVLPSERSATMTVRVTATQGQSILGTELKRARVLITSIDNPFYYAVTRANIGAAAPSAAMVVGPNVILDLRNADAIYLRSAHATDPATIGICVETWAS
jgi:hypothetical protein